MQIFLENTSQYAGNFAKESTQTITGSLGLLQTSVNSFVSGIGNANVDMTKLTTNVTDAFGAVAKSIVLVLKNVVVALPPAVGAIMIGVGELLPMVLEAFVGLFVQVLGC